MNAQATFNHRYVFNRINTVFTGVAVTDSAYYVIGIITDSVPYKFVGASMMTFNQQGERTGEKVVKEPDRWFEPWSYNLVPTNRGSFIGTGYTSFPRKGMLIEYFPALDSIRKVEFDGPWGPGSFYGLSNGLLTDGNYVILNPNTRPSNIYNSELAILKFNKDLFLSSFRVFTHPWHNFSGAMCIQDNNLIISENLYNINLTGYNFTSQLHVFALDSLGQKTWEYLSPLNESWNYPYGILPLDDGGILVGLSREYLINYPNGPTDSLSLAVEEPWIMKLGADHQRAWAFPLFDEYRHPFNQTSKIIPATDGGGYIAAGVGYLPYPGQSGAIGLLKKFNDEGEPLWSRRLFYVDTIDHEQYIYDIKPCPDGGYIMCGQVRQPVDTVNYTSTQQGWLLKTDQYGCLVPGCQGPVATEEPDHPAPPGLLVYPNPATDMLAVYLSGPKPAGEAFFRLIDPLGRVLQEAPAAETDATYIFTLGAWPPGRYAVQYWVEGRLAAVKAWIKGL